MVRIILVGGFLGAGKTTLLSRATKILMDRGYRVGVITNDQGENLVDTALLKTQNIAVQEIAGGCFCCRFHDLHQAVEQIHQTNQPDVILAEPVGSCTDLMATVVRPFIKHYGPDLTIAPLTILVDPTRKVDETLSDVEYLYKKQISEADIIVINKRDLLDDRQLSDTITNYKSAYPQSQVTAISAQSGDGLDEWLEVCLSQSSSAEQVIDVDYEIYAAAEARLGWLNARGTISTNSAGINPSAFIEETLHYIKAACLSNDIFIAHAKIHLKHNKSEYKASLINTHEEIIWDLLPNEEKAFEEVDFIINVRIATSPDKLENMAKTALHTAASKLDSRIDFQSFDCFSPLPPEPVFHIQLEDL